MDTGHRRLLAALALIALAAVTLAAGPAHGEGGRIDATAPAGMVTADSGDSQLRSLRAIAEGERPETPPLGQVLLADGDPAELGTGVRMTLMVVDVDGDGDEDLLQLVGTFSRPSLALSDAATGVVLWTSALPTANFLLRLVPAEAGHDLAVITGEGAFFAQVVGGATGEVQWRRQLPGGDVLHLLGVAAAGDGHDLVIGVSGFAGPQLLSLDVEYRSLADGGRTGAVALIGEGQHPTAALTGDVDGDGIGDLLTYEPIYLFGGGTAGAVRTLTARGAAESWSTTFLHDVSDYTWLLTSADVTGDGIGDAVLLSDFLGLFGAGQSSTLSVVDGRGGIAAGARPAVRTGLASYAQTYTGPIDIGADGTEELIFSGAVYTSTVGRIVFEAIGRGGVVWRTGVDHAVDDPGSNFGYGWYPDAGDLDGDGVHDALALLGTRTAGPQAAVAVSQAGGVHLWRTDELGGRFPVPADADLDGDGGDDLLDGIGVTHPTFSTTRVEFTAIRGRDRRVLWSHERTLGMRTGYSLTASGIPDGPTDDVVVEYNVSAGRHFAESLDGLTGSVGWTSP